MMSFTSTGTQVDVIGLVQSLLKLKKKCNLLTKDLDSTSKEWLTQKNMSKYCTAD